MEAFKRSLYGLPICSNKAEIAFRTLFDAMEIISEVEVEAPIKKGDILIENVLGTGAVNVIATRDVRRLKE